MATVIDKAAIFTRNALSVTARLRVPSGLERLADREFRALGIDGRVAKYRDDLVFHGPIQSIWKASLQSSVCDGVYVFLGEKVNASDPRKFKQALHALDWEDYFPLSISMADPEIDIRVTGGNAMGAAGARAVVLEVIHERVAKAVKKFETKRDNDAYRLRGFGTRPPPRIDIRIEDTTAQIAIEASDDLSNRYWLVAKEPTEGAGHKATSKNGGDATNPFMSTQMKDKHGEDVTDVKQRGANDRAAQAKAALGSVTKAKEMLASQPVPANVAAACVLTSPLLKLLADDSKRDAPMPVWDPLCGNGVMLLEAACLAEGWPATHPTKRFGFREWPSFVARDFYGVTAQMEVEAHPMIDNLRLIGSDPRQALVDCAVRNRDTLIARAPRTNGNKESVSRLLTEHTKFVQSDWKKLSAQIPEPLLLTAMPRTFGSGQVLRHMHRDLAKLVASRSDWRGVYVLTAHAAEFNQLTGLKWKPELRIQNVNGQALELVSWTGGYHSEV